MWPSGACVGRRRHSFCKSVISWSGVLDVFDSYGLVVDVIWDVIMRVFSDVTNPDADFIPSHVCSGTCMCVGMLAYAREKKGAGAESLSGLCHAASVIALRVTAACPEAFD